MGKERLRTYFEINWFSYEVKWPSTRSLDTPIVKAVWLKVTLVSEGLSFTPTCSA